MPLPFGGLARVRTAIPRRSAPLNTILRTRRGSPVLPSKPFLSSPLLSWQHPRVRVVIDGRLLTRKHRRLHARLKTPPVHTTYALRVLLPAYAAGIIAFWVRLGGMRQRRGLILRGNAAPHSLRMMLNRTPFAVPWGVGGKIASRTLVIGGSCCCLLLGGACSDCPRAHGACS